MRIHFVPNQADESEQPCVDSVDTLPSGHQSAACNVFLQRDQRELPLFRGRLAVEEVSQERIRLRFEDDP